MERQQEESKVDLIIVGGGVTGAGVFREAVRNGLRCLLVEQKDFAWGTSSRSSKLIHGGLRYLKEAQFKLTLESVKERERLLADAEGLVSPIDFLMPLYESSGPGRAAMAAGLTVYDIIAGKFRHRYLRSGRVKELVPGINTGKLKGGYLFMDAQVDDARLVLRLIGEGTRQGGRALNYTEARSVLRDEKGAVCGVSLKDVATGDTWEVSAPAVINATGVWAESLHPSPEAHLHLRPLRGSHLVFSRETLPVEHAISFFHPVDKRPLFIIPWEGVVLLGTTDLDHEGDVNLEPAISDDEAEYLLAALKRVIPHAEVTRDDALTSFAGVRPVLSEGRKEASRESREHAVWVDRGLVTVTGGKLTTFRKLAWDTLKAAQPFIREDPLTGEGDAVFSERRGTTPEGLKTEVYKRLWSRYGKGTLALLALSVPRGLEPIAESPYVWAELAYAAEHESVSHLDDLLLRRVRIGLVLKNGGLDQMPAIREVVQNPLNWDDERWEREVEAYDSLWKRCYSPRPVKD
ncbi:glycerol-3-phosphate dehydrogenase/oxidase [Desulfoluna spongiiphila]|uniref:Glycerol-3-phosphate dehydrogenase n=1 Tax=Desulfoluna spongiiphila TaxID=419481 RepID=A0A1G5DMT7_9BACT|nr:glycerol-3-phosphate dehydrogenase/oxidase [Desulfoluna spongiiphila]SCY15821.1 glycerol-3-phosphate dehydrogenase [Desulfoluna spongiiphila]VVS95052.1 fad dependent oxidoreductase [Desulfoluna spongiiphila]